MADAKLSWNGNFSGVAWRIHDENPIDVPTLALAQFTIIFNIL
jgi:hypothetical protein